MNKYHVATATAVSLLAAALPAGAATNYVLNGDFELSTPNNTGTYPTSAGGIGQIGQIVTLPDWTKTVTNDQGSGGFAFVADANADNNTPGASYPNQGGGFPSIFSPGNSSNIFLWGPDFSANPVSNGFTGSSNGGKFLAAFGDYGRSKVSQTVTGLTAGNQYTLSFEYAGAQATDSTGDTQQYWSFDLGTGTVNLTPWINPSQGFTDWQTYSTTFTATDSFFTLGFEPFGASTGGPGELSPVLLLDDVQVVDFTPPPPTSVPGPLPVLGAGAAFSWSRRLRRTLKTRRG